MASESVSTLAHLFIFWGAWAGSFLGFLTFSGTWGHHFEANFRAAAQSKYSAARVSSARHFAFACCESQSSNCSNAVDGLPFAWHTQGETSCWDWAPGFQYFADTKTHVLKIGVNEITVPFNQVLVCILKLYLQWVWALENFDIAFNLTRQFP